MAMKKKFLKEIYKLLGETDESNVRPLSRTVSPDVVDLAGLLRCSGFRLSKVDFQPVARPPLLSAGTTCSVQLTCARSGLHVLLESEGACRCPEAATSVDDSVSTWVVESPVSPSCSQENLSKSRQAGSSLLPEVSPAAAEVVSVAVSSILKLIGEEGATQKTGNLGSRATIGKKPRRPSLSAESNLQVIAQPGRSGSEMVQSRSLDDMDWEAETKNIAPSFQDLSISAISSTSKSEEQLLLVIQHVPPVTGAEASTTPLGAAAPEMPPPPRRQSSTLEDYLKFKQCLGDNNSDPTPSQASSESGSSGATGSAVSALPSMRAQSMLEKAQVARQSLDDLILSLKQCIIGSDIGEAATAVTPLEGKRTKPKQPSGGVPDLRTTELSTRPQVTKATIFKTLRRETVAVPWSNSGTPRPQQPRRLKGPAPLPRVPYSPKDPHMPPKPVPRPAKAAVAQPTKNTPRPPKQGLRLLSAGSSPSGPSSLPYIPVSFMLGSQPSGIATRSPAPRRQSDGTRSLMNPQARPHSHK